MRGFIALMFGMFMLFIGIASAANFGISDSNLPKLEAPTSNIFINETLFNVNNSDFLDGYHYNNLPYGNVTTTISGTLGAMPYYNGANTIQPSTNFNFSGNRLIALFGTAGFETRNANSVKRAFLEDGMVSLYNTNKHTDIYETDYGTLNITSNVSLKCLFYGDNTKQCSASSGNISGSGNSNHFAFWTDNNTIGWLPWATDALKGLGYYVNLKNTYGGNYEYSIELYKGWNAFSLIVNQTEFGNFTIPFVSGWNLLGYSGDRPFRISDIEFNISGSICQYPCNGDILIKDPLDTSGTGTFNYTDGVLTRGSAFWLYASADGNMTYYNIGGTPLGETYLWSDLMFENGSGVVKNVTDAANANWTQSTLYYSSDNGNFYTICGSIVCDKTDISSWEGLFILSNNDNINIIFNPTPQTNMWDLKVLSGITSNEYCNSTGTCKDLSEWGLDGGMNYTNIAMINKTNIFNSNQTINGWLNLSYPGTGAIILGKVYGSARGNGAIDIQSSGYDYQVAVGDNSICLGYANTANKSGSVAIGQSENIVGDYAIGLGSNSIIDGTQTIGIGAGVMTTAATGIGIGAGAAVDGETSTVIGSTASSSADCVGGIALGYGAHCGHFLATAIGGASTSQDSSVDIGGYDTTKMTLWADGTLSLSVVDLPSCDGTITGHMGRNTTGTYGCNSTQWMRLF